MVDLAADLTGDSQDHGNPDPLARATVETGGGLTAEHVHDVMELAKEGPRRRVAALLERVCAVFRQYVVFPDDLYCDVVALWVLHTYAIAAAETTPRLVLKSPEKESGKTRALEVLDLLVESPQSAFNVSASYVFRKLAVKQVTLLIDECDAVFGPKASNHEDLRALLNAGYRRGATIGRVVTVGRSQRAEDFPAFAAAALAAIGDLPDTIESRAVIVPMRRRAPHEPVERFRLKVAREASADLRKDLGEWAVEFVDTLTAANPTMPEGIDDRAADCWEPLLAIADLAGADWSRRARDAALRLAGGRVDQDASVGVRLLADIRTVFDGRDRMSSAGLCAALNGLEESSWGGWSDGKGIRPHDLAFRLKPYGVRATVIRLADGSTPRGYRLADLADAFDRYLRGTNATKRNETQQAPRSNRPDVADVASVALVVEDAHARNGSSLSDDPPIDPFQKGATNATGATQDRNPLRFVADVADESAVVDPEVDALLTLWASECGEAPAGVEPVTAAAESAP